MSWLKVQKSTARKPEVLRLSVELGIHPDHAFGLCFRFWCWCDDQLCDGNVPGVTPELIDGLIGHAGFASALVDVGWLQVRSGSLVIPRFDRHLSESAKNRALSAERTKRSRSKGNQKSNADVTLKSLPEKIREDKNTKRKYNAGEDSIESPANASNAGFLTGPSPEFLRFWAEYPKKVGRQAACDAWDWALVQIESERGIDYAAAIEWLITKTEDFAKSKLGRSGKFIPNPDKFLIQQRFFDDPAEWEKDNGSDRDTGRRSSKRQTGRHHSDATADDLEAIVFKTV